MDDEILLEDLAESLLFFKYSFLTSSEESCDDANLASDLPPFLFSPRNESLPSKSQEQINNIISNPQPQPSTSLQAPVRSSERQLKIRNQRESEVAPISIKLPKKKPTGKKGRSAPKKEKKLLNNRSSQGSRTNGWAPLETKLDKEDPIGNHSYQGSMSIGNPEQEPKLEKEDPIGNLSSQNTMCCPIVMPQDELKIQCPNCARTFAAERYLRMHTYAHHSGEKPFRCSKCGKKFPNAEECQKHFKRHDNDNKQLKCSECPAQFNYTTDLNRHSKSAHLKEFPYKCHICYRGFIRGDYLKNHVYVCGKGKGTKKNIK